VVVFGLLRYKIQRICKRLAARGFLLDISVDANYKAVGNFVDKYIPASLRYTVVNYAPEDVPIFSELGEAITSESGELITF